MHEQDGTQSLIQQHRTRQINTVNQTNSEQVPTVQHPASDDSTAWNGYWKVLGQPWRTEPEIDEERQKYIALRQSITPDIKQGIYPFKDIELSRADVEWLLAKHENGRGAVDWNDKIQRTRKGLDLRGANLRQVNLSGLPLARMRGALLWVESNAVTKEQRNMAVVQLQGANLRDAQLQEANLRYAQLQEANLNGAQLQGANLMLAQMQKANLIDAQLQGADLASAQLQEANLRYAQLQEANLYGAQLQKADLRDAQLQHANLIDAQLQHANLRDAQLQHANLFDVQLQEADLIRAQLQKANLARAQLQKANLARAQLQGANLHAAVLEDAILYEVTLRDQTYGSARLADIKWGEVNLAVIDWGHVKELGDEQVAQQEKVSGGWINNKQKKVNEYKQAVRANRQLAVVLGDQGLNEEADRFAYRAQLLQRKVLWRDHEFGRWLFSMLLALLSGYGYRIWRILAAYLVVVSVFALVYFILGRYYPPHLPLHQAFLESITAFHGRVFFEQFNLDTPQIWFTALEAIAGLIIEGVFIAMLIQRFFGK